jgi:signal recognition particle subunit SRP54
LFYLFLLFLRQQPISSQKILRRIAEGSGLSQVEVNRFLKQFGNAAKMAKKFSGKKGMQDLQNMLAQSKHAHLR